MSSFFIDWDKCGGLLPAVAQEHKSSEVLMLAYMDKQALDMTLSSGYAHYFSRTKNRIWKKGEESGNLQIIKDVLLDCDGDALLLKVEQVGGVACHTGNKTCFFKSILESRDFSNPLIDVSQKYSIIDTLYHTILDKAHTDEQKSYTASLFKKGENHILKKVAEESAEFIIACKDGKEDEIIYEASDVVYHALVELAYRGINPDKIAQEIKRRFGTSGIDEKNSRTQ